MVSFLTVELGRFATLKLALDFRSSKQRYRFSGLLEMCLDLANEYPRSTSERPGPA